MTREELIVKVEGLTGPDEETDRIVSKQHLNWSTVNFTGSVDAVLALIQERLPEWRVYNYWEDNFGAWAVSLMPRDAETSHSAKYGVGKTPALALLAAYLRANQQKNST